MMTIGTSMWGFRNEDIRSVLSYCAHAGILSIEAQVHPQAPSHFSFDMPDAELARVLGDAADLGIAIEALSVANDFMVAAERLPAELERVMAGIRLAVRMSVRRMRVFAGFRNPADIDGDQFDRMIAALRTVARRAEAEGLQLALENHGGVTATAVDVVRMLDRIDVPNGLGALYDAVNFVRAGDDPLRALRLLAGRIVYTHAKDLTPGGKVCAVGDGVMPWKAIVAEVAKDPDALVIIEQTDPDDVRAVTARSAGAIAGWLVAYPEARI